MLIRKNVFYSATADTSSGNKEIMKAGKRGKEEVANKYPILVREFAKKDMLCKTGFEAVGFFSSSTGKGLLADIMNDRTMQTDSFYSQILANCLIIDCSHLVLQTDMPDSMALKNRAIESDYQKKLLQQFLGCELVRKAGFIEEGAAENLQGYILSSKLFGIAFELLATKKAESMYYAGAQYKMAPVKEKPEEDRWVFSESDGRVQISLSQVGLLISKISPSLAHPELIWKITGMSPIKPTDFSHLYHLKMNLGLFAELDINPADSQKTAAYALARWSYSAACGSLRSQIRLERCIELSKVRQATVTLNSEKLRATMENQWIENGLITFWLGIMEAGRDGIIRFDNDRFGGDSARGKMFYLNAGAFLFHKNPELDELCGKLPALRNKVLSAGIEAMNSSDLERLMAEMQKLSLISESSLMQVSAGGMDVKCCGIFKRCLSVALFLMDYIDEKDMAVLLKGRSFVDLLTLKLRFISACDFLEGQLEKSQRSFSKEGKEMLEGIIELKKDTTSREFDFCLCEFAGIKPNELELDTRDHERALAFVKKFEGLPLTYWHGKKRETVCISGFSSSYSPSLLDNKYGRMKYAKMDGPEKTRYESIEDVAEKIINGKLVERH
jgi:hypothetical protein